MAPSMQKCLILVLVLALAGLAACRRADEPAVQIRALTAIPRPPEVKPVAIDADLPWLPSASPLPSATAVPEGGAVRTSTVVAVRGGGTGTPPVVRTTPQTAGRSANPTTDPGLLAAIVAALGSDSEDASVVVRRLTDGAEARWRDEEVYYAASLYKLEVLYEAFRQRQAGQISFAQDVTLTGSALAEDLGTFDRVPRGENGVPLGEAVRAMVTWSDNVSAALLLDTLGHRTIDATMASLGLTHSSVNTVELPTTAADMARLMEAIVRGQGVGGQAASDMTALLLKQEMRFGIPAGLPAGTPAGSKWGAWPGSSHDVGFVVAPHGAYVIAVLTARGWDWNLIARVSAAVWSYFEGAGR